MINETIFLEVIGNLKSQFDKDTERSNVLSNIYNKDIDPTDNSLLTDAVFLLLKQSFFEEQLNEIKIFCYDQNFGRAHGVNRTVNDLWFSLLSHIEVVDEMNLSQSILEPGTYIEWTLEKNHSEMWGGQTFRSVIISVDNHNKKYLVEAEYGMDNIKFNACKISD